MDISLEFIKNEKRFSHHFAPYRTVDLISSNCTKINHNVFICSIKYCLIISPQSFRFMPFILLSHCVLNSVCIVISCSFIISHLVFCFFWHFLLTVCSSATFPQTVVNSIVLALQTQWRTCRADVHRVVWQQPHYSMSVMRVMPVYTAVITGTAFLCVCQQS